MTDAPRDEDLVRRFLSGDRAAFAALVERHERRVYNLALRMTGREEDARDATQDALLTVLKKLAWPHKSMSSKVGHVVAEKQLESALVYLRNEKDKADKNDKAGKSKKPKEPKSAPKKKR